MRHIRTAGGALALALLAFLADDVMPRAERWWRTTLVVVDWRGWWPHVSFHGVGRAQQ